jgi:hypothetical protein
VTGEHTPGPWKSTPIPASRCYKIDAGAGGVHWKELATVWGNDDLGLNRQGSANARLIAAAPELLEALRWLAGCAGKLGVCPVRDLDETLERARAVRVCPRLRWPPPAPPSPRPRAGDGTPHQLPGRVLQ